jgi:hypothetical protein
LHEKYAREGLVAVSVSLDDPKETGAKENVLKFLRARNANLTNLILDENQDFWQKKFNMDGPPSVYVFNREGKWKQWVGGEPYPEVEKLVVEFLKAK